MKKYNIPTAFYEVFTESDKAIAYLKGAEQLSLLLSRLTVSLSARALSSLRTRKKLLLLYTI